MYGRRFFGGAKRQTHVDIKRVKDLAALVEIRKRYPEGCFNKTKRGTPERITEATDRNAADAGKRGDDSWGLGLKPTTVCLFR